MLPLLVADTHAPCLPCPLSKAPPSACLIIHLSARQIEKAQERASLESQPKPLKPEQLAEVEGLRSQAKGKGWWGAALRHTVLRSCWLGRLQAAALVPPHCPTQGSLPPAHPDPILPCPPSLPSCLHLQRSLSAARLWPRREMWMAPWRRWPRRSGCGGMQTGWQSGTASQTGSWRSAR